MKPSRAIFAGLVGAAMWATSGYLVEKFLGTAANLAYLPIAIIGTIAMTWLADRLRSQNDRGGFACAFAILLAVCAVLAIVYPKLDTHDDPMKGSDRDDALNNGALAILHGHYPYYYPTYQGLPPSPMPGAFLLAMPFAVVRSSAWQIPLWLAIFAWLLKKLSGNWWTAAIGLALLVGGWAAMTQEIATGGDYSVNGVYVTCAALILVESMSGFRSRRGADLSRPPEWWWQSVAAAVLLGVALSSRSPHLMLIPPLAFWLWREARWRGVALIAMPVATFALLTIPFYLYDPPHFGPTMMQDKLGDLNGGLPHAAAILGALGAGIAVLSLPLRGRLGGGDRCLIAQSEPIDAPRPHLTSPGGGGIRLVLLVYALAMFIPVAIASIILLIRGGDPWLIRWASMAVPPMLVASLIPDGQPVHTPPADTAASAG